VRRRTAERTVAAHRDRVIETGNAMNAWSKIRNSEAFNMTLGVGAVLIIGFGTATAAIRLGDDARPNPAMRPLATGPSIRLTSAYGHEDEDCAWVTNKVTVAGQIRLLRTLDCAR
jgi:hypothetical protein